mmetsp:Transcript_56726/g.104147  ORF Transcript_56726/g.104147 Transcript_56726/m.104147 type:complete len:278 (-) Transcript_56726:3236-4069(-)
MHQGLVTPVHSIDEAVLVSHTKHITGFGFHGIRCKGPLLQILCNAGPLSCIKRDLIEPVAGAQLARLFPSLLLRLDNPGCIRQSGHKEAAVAQAMRNILQERIHGFLRLKGVMTSHLRGHQVEPRLANVRQARCAMSRLLVQDRGQAVSPAICTNQRHLLQGHAHFTKQAMLGISRSSPKLVHSNCKLFQGLARDIHSTVLCHPAISKLLQVSTLATTHIKNSQWWLTHVSARGWLTPPFLGSSRNSHISKRSQEQCSLGKRIEIPHPHSLGFAALL